VADLDDELLDVVDGFDRVIGTVNRKDYAQFLNDRKGFIRAAELFILTDQGKLWVPVRTADKTIAPNGYDYAAGGHVESGDDYLTTILRETEEETNLRLTADDLEFVGILKSTAIRYIRAVYLYRSNVTPVFNPNDFVGGEWLTPTELRERIDAGHPAKKNLRSAVGVLESYLSGY
jgi:8-oxo-dGTP pyrophosphatase MutT (NUDIX family)